MSTPAQPTHNKWTIIDALNWTTDYFKSHDIDSPRTSAEIFLGHALQVRRIDLYLHHDQPLNQEELNRFKQLIKRRVTREPAAYIIGKREFWSLDLNVTKDTLIPRPDTECLVETALACLPDRVPDQSPCRILDLGTGSGAIILAMAKERPGHLYYATDRFLPALNIARQNAMHHHLDDRISFICGDWLSVFKDTQQFDMILSNPPYIPTDTLQTLQPEINLFEPLSALDGGENGLDSLSRIAVDAHKNLKPGGVLIMEMGYDQKQGMNTISENIGRYDIVDFIKDYSGHDRVVKLQKKE